MSYIFIILTGFLVGVLLNYIITKIEKKDAQKIGLVEVITVLTFLFIFLQEFNSALDFLFYLTVFSFLIIIFVYDLKHFIIPNVIIYPLTIITVLYFLVFKYEFILNHIFSATVAFLFFFSVYYLTKEKGIGFGDVRYSFFMGFFLGYPDIITGLFLSFFLGAIFGIILMIFGKKGRKSALPFAPFLITGTFIAAFYGEKVLNFYLNLHAL